MSAEVEALVQALRAHRPVLDRTFDQVFLAEHRGWSRDHWTPVEVAQRAMAWLACGKGEAILDVGAGGGKLCLIGALSCAARFVGLEQRPELVQCAQRAAKLLRVERQIEFRRAGLDAVDWLRFAGVYLYNPFGELLLVPDDRHAFASEEPRSTFARREAYDRHVEEVQRRLDELRPGTRVVTYHGFGGQMPRGFEQMGREVIARGPLELWIKRGPGRTP